MAETDKSQ